MASQPPFRFSLAQISAIRLRNGFAILHTATYSLPTLHLSLLPQLPKTEQSCRSCGLSFIHQLPGQGPPERPVVLPCGHIGGHRCLDYRLNTAVPTCFVCARVLPLRPSDKVGVHGPAGQILKGGAVGGGARIESLLQRERVLGAGMARAVTRDGGRGVSIGGVIKFEGDGVCGNLASASDEAITTGQASMQRTMVSTVSAPRGQAAKPDVSSQVTAAMGRGYGAEDIEAAKILLDLSAGDAGWTSSSSTGSDDPPQPGSTKGEYRPTSEEIEEAVKRVNSVYGVSLTLEDLQVALTLSDTNNGTETKVEDVLRGWY